MCWNFRNIRYIWNLCFKVFAQNSKGLIVESISIFFFFEWKCRYIRSNITMLKWWMLTKFISTYLILFPLLQQIFFTTLNHMFYKLNTNIWSDTRAGYVQRTLEGESKALYNTATSTEKCYVGSVFRWY